MYVHTVYTYPFGVLLCNSTRHSASYRTQAGLLTLITSLARSPDIIDTNHHTIHGRDDFLGVGIRGHSATKGYLYIYTYIHIYVDVHVYIRIHICIYIYTQGRPGTLYICAWAYRLISPSVNRRGAKSPTPEASARHVRHTPALQSPL